MHQALPGFEIVEAGLRDLGAGRDTLHASLVSMAVDRLEKLGYSVHSPHANPEPRLYRRLQETFGDGAHSKYNAYRRRLAKFIRAAVCATSSTPKEFRKS